MKNGVSKDTFKVVSLIFLSLSLSSLAESKRFLVYGAHGWIGSTIVRLLQDEGQEAHAAHARLENREALVSEISSIKPDFVINAAGITGRPNIDWCEDHHQETLRANILGALNLADVCFMHNVHMTNLGTGCIYEYDAKHPVNSGIGFTEEEEPNFFGSFYSKTKVMLDKLLLFYPNVVNLRLRMPISDDLSDRSFVTKISRYKKVVNIPNSMTILYDLLPLIPQICLRKLTGCYNFVNPGTVSHNEILDLYKLYIDPAFTYENFTIEEHDKILKSKRSNNELNAAKLLKEFPQIPHIKESIVKVFERMKHNLQINGEQK